MLAVLVLISVVGCGGLPDNFETLPLAAKVKAYERHFRMGGRTNLRAELWISWHGKPAAEMMIPYILGERRGISKSDAIKILWDVQLRGCTLSGSDSERALEKFLKWTQPFDPNFQRAERALDSIRRDSHIAHFDSLPRGPCNPTMGWMSSWPAPCRRGRMTPGWYPAAFACPQAARCGSI